MGAQAIQISMTLETAHTLDINKATGSGPNPDFLVTFGGNTGPLTSTKTLFAIEPQTDVLDSDPGLDVTIALGGKETTPLAYAVFTSVLHLSSAHKPFHLLSIFFITYLFITKVSTHPAQQGTR